MTGSLPIPQALLDGLSREEIARTVNTLMAAEWARAWGLDTAEHVTGDGTGSPRGLGPLLEDARDTPDPRIVVHRRCRVCGYDSVRDDDPTWPGRYWRADGVCASCPR